MTTKNMIKIVRFWRFIVKFIVNFREGGSTLI